MTDIRKLTNASRPGQASVDPRALDPVCVLQLCRSVVMQLESGGGVGAIATLGLAARKSTLRPVSCCRLRTQQGGGVLRQGGQALLQPASQGPSWKIDVLGTAFSNVEVSRQLTSDYGMGHLLCE